MQAQTVDEVLSQIERNNKELQAQEQTIRASKLEVQAENNLEDPSVEYSPFYTRGISGMSSSELVVTQGFDFPTLYAARRQSGKWKQEVLDRQLRIFRRDILLNAKNLCLDLILYNQKQTLLVQRKKNADELLVLFEKRLKEGDVGVLDVNKIKMELMNVQTEVVQNEAAHRSALQQLLAMNGNLPLEFTENTYPSLPELDSYNELYDEIMSTDATLLVADANVRAAEKELKVNRQSWLPKFEVGYRRNTSLDEKSNGFLVGGSLPLFSNRKKGKIIQAQVTSAKLQVENARLQAEAQVQSRYNEICKLREAMQAYDVGLMYKTLDLLNEAVKAGQLSIIEFYTEADNVYQNLQAYMELENQYQKLMADIYKNRL
jgi:outer membrane protein TolC